MIGYPSQSDAADVLARLSGTISDAATDRSVGVGEHSDYGCFTILNVDPLAENTLQVM